MKRSRTFPDLIRPQLWTALKVTIWGTIRSICLETNLFFTIKMSFWTWHSLTVLPISCYAAVKALGVSGCISITYVKL